MNHRTSIRAASVLAAAASMVLAGLAPTSALAAPRGSTQVPTNTNYAGWLAGSFDRHVTVKSAASTFIVPTVTCTTSDANTFVVIGVGLPTGTTTVIALGVAVGCNGTNPFYTGELDINGTVTPLSATILPGDKVTTSLVVTPTTTSGSFTDATHVFHASIHGKGGSPSGACIGIDGSENGKHDPLVPVFSKVVFSNGTLNKMPISTSGATRVNMASSTGVLQISTGKLTTSGKGFTSKFVATGG